MEALTWQNLAIGMLASMACMHFGSKFLPYSEISNINFFKLATYPFYLIGQIYVSGFYVIKVILTGAEIDIVTLKTEISCESLRIMLAHSITITPGSILLDFKDEFLTILWIRDKNKSGDEKTADEFLKQKLERRLLKAEKAD